MNEEQLMEEIESCYRCINIYIFHFLCDYHAEKKKEVMKSDEKVE